MNCETIVLVSIFHFFCQAFAGKQGALLLFENLHTPFPVFFLGGGGYMINGEDGECFSTNPRILLINQTIQKLLSCSMFKGKLVAIDVNHLLLDTLG